MSNQVEKEIQEKGLTAPRITPALIESTIVSEHYFTAADAIAPPVNKLVDRFLGWKLPRDFAPDSGIAFKAIQDPLMWPVGTNLFNAGQAKEMFEHALGSQQAPAPLTLLTFCVLTLKNGFTVTGESACASPENFNAEIGRKIARENAVAKIWPLMGYELKTKLANQN